MKLMKRTLFALSVVFCLMLSACGGSSESQARPFTTADLEGILACGGFSETLEAVDSELVCALYGLDATLVTDCAGYLSTGATAEEAVVFIATDASAAEQIKSACDLRVDDQILAYEDYGPAEVPKLENAHIEVRENTVLMVVATDADAVDTAVEALK